MIALFYKLLCLFKFRQDIECKLGFHIFDNKEIGTSFNNCVDYYCGNCQKFMFSNHVENSDIVKRDYDMLVKL